MMQSIHRLGYLKVIANFLLLVLVTLMLINRIIQARSVKVFLNLSLHLSLSSMMTLKKVHSSILIISMKIVHNFYQAMMINRKFN